MEKKRRKKQKNNNKAHAKQNPVKFKPAPSSAGIVISKGSKKRPTYQVIKPCRHLMHAFHIHDNVLVYPSSLHLSEKTDDLPDFGLYADYAWEPLHRNEFIDWPDFALPTDEMLALEQITDAVHRACDGQVVELGCIGGHGRTGTILAIMRVVMGDTATGATSEVREKYCSRAVETPEQVRFVEATERRLKGVDAPERPWSPRNVGFQSKYKSNMEDIGLDTCLILEHKAMWEQGDINCTNKKYCKEWELDVEDFEEELH